jgi:hypothetical protein
MPRNSTIKNAALVLLLTALVLGVMQLFLLRFQTGDIYPAYSSLRSDPLGTRAFYESLGKFDHIDRRRNYQPLDSLKPDANAVLFYLGAEIPQNDSIPRKMSQTLDGLTASGGRLVITYLPVYQKKEDSSNSDHEDSSSDSSNADSGDNTQNDQSDAQPDPETKPQTGLDDSPKPPGEPEESEPDVVSIRDHWGFDFGYATIPEARHAEKKQPVFKAYAGLPDLPAAISWHTNLYFEPLDNSWRTVYAVDGKPVVIERKMGQGSIVLCSDSFFISNEAMRGERHPQMLVWLMGGQSTVIFDESHFGLYKVPGVAGLLRRYQFHWFIGALAVVALLFIWKNGVYFVPPPEEETVVDAQNVSEKDYSRGLVALLRRNVGRSEILQVCGREWERTFKNDQRIDPDAIAQMKRILKTAPADSKKKSGPVSGYQKISRTFKRLGTYTSRG